MVRRIEGGVYLLDGRTILTDQEYHRRQSAGLPGCQLSREQARQNTMSYGILQAHNIGTGDQLRLKFDALASHDMTNVGIIQTARACGLQEFPIPTVLTNCQNTLCAVGGTINRDDHIFALNAAQKYGGICVPVNTAVIHTYVREMLAACGGMIMGADSHTRYGALGTMGVGEGGGELVKQLLGQSYDLEMPSITAVYLTGSLRPGVGPHDVALAMIGSTFPSGFVKDSVLEFVGDGISSLSVDFRNGIDVMTTETGCLTSIWETDDAVRNYMKVHGRDKDYRFLHPGVVSYYDRMVYVDLSTVEPMIAMPFHPSNVYTIAELNANTQDILHKVEADARALTDNSKLDLMCKYRNGAFYVDSGSIGGCSGGSFENLMAVSQIMDGQSVGNGPFDLTIYPDSQPTNLELVRHGATARLMEAGVICREAICGPCTGVGEIPGNNEFSVRHNTRNFIYREGARPGDGQHAWVGLMDARSIAATARNGGRLTAATSLEVDYAVPEYHFEKKIYDKRVYYGVGNPKPETILTEGPNIKPWPDIPAMPEHLLVKLCSYIDDEVTTTDELIPSGDTSSYRSNPIQMASFTLCRRDPAYVGEARAVQALEARRAGGDGTVWNTEELAQALTTLERAGINVDALRPGMGIGSGIYARRPGDGSAREQAASCQRILGGAVNIAEVYATRRYRANLINWGILPFELTKQTDQEKFRRGDWLFLPNICRRISEGDEVVEALILGKEPDRVVLSTGPLSKKERAILAAGCMINEARLEK